MVSEALFIATEDWKQSINKWLVKYNMMLPRQGILCSCQKAWQLRMFWYGVRTKMDCYMKKIKTHMGHILYYILYLCSFLCKEGRYVYL